MTVTTETIVVRQQDMTVDQILFLRFKRYRQGVVERVFAMNPGLAASGPFLPLGQTFEIPIDAPNNTPAVVPLITLWS